MEHKIKKTKFVLRVSCFMLQERGQAAITAVIFLLAITLSVLAAISGFALKETKGAERNFRSRVSFFTAEAGVDDVVYRLMRGKNVSSSFSISLNGSTSTTTVSDVLGAKQVVSSGEFLESFRFLRATLFTGTGADFFYGVQVGAGGLSMNNNSAINGNVYSNGVITGSNGAKIIGDAVSVGSIEDMTIGSSTAGNARAPSFINTTVHGSLCPNQYCVVENLPEEDFPIPQSNIDLWKNDAIAGGTISGSCGTNGVSGCDISDNGILLLGPKKITGNLVLTKKQTLTVTGTLYFQGNIDIDSTSGAAVKCDSLFGNSSCVLISDGWIHIQNNVLFQGSGASGSYVLVLSTKQNCNGGSGGSSCTHHGGAIDLHNNSTGAIFYAADSMAHLHNGVNVSQLTANKLELENNSVVNYESGLANINFSSGPSGGWSVLEWKEVIQ